MENKKPAPARGRRPADGHNGRKPSDADTPDAGVGDTPQAEAHDRSEAGGERDPASVLSRPLRYLIAPVAVASAEAADLFAAVGKLPDVRLLTRIVPVAHHDGVAVACPEVAVIQASPRRAAELTASGRWHVEEDKALHPASGFGTGLTVTDPGLLPLGEPDQVDIVVTDPEGIPIAGVGVCLVADWPAYAVSDKTGRATLTAPPGVLAGASALVVRPTAGYWSRVITQPALTPGSDHTVRVDAFSAFFDGFPGKALVGWGAQAIGVGQLPPTYRGHGVRVAVLDSGIASPHPEFDQRITRGANLTDDPASWSVDRLGGGTAIAGVINAKDSDFAVTGLAVDAEVHAVKVTPGGWSSSLLRALNYCVEHDIDVAVLGPSLAVASPLLAAKLTDAHHAGVAVITGTGDTPGPIGFPALLSTVLAVGAIGRHGTFPTDSVHAVHARPAGTGQGDIAATFTATGPSVDVCAPGVAVISTAAPDGYAAVDGTAIAAAHIAGLAALVLAHRDDFRTTHAERGPGRVEHLFHILRASSRPQADPARTGAGLPDARIALDIPEPAPVDGDYEAAVLQHLHYDLVRAGHIPPEPTTPR